MVFRREWTIHRAGAVGLALMAGLLAQPAPMTAQAQGNPAWFVDEAAKSGLDFVHHNGMTGQFYFHEMMGAGVALLDYDNDGDLDIYAVQGHSLERGAAADPAMTDRLFENQTTPGSSALRFVDVTASSGLDARGYGMGVTVGDVDNDGWVDIYLANFEGNQLWRNRGKNASGKVTFEDVSAAYKVGDRGWGVSTSMVDFDRDGWLDLYVTNYVAFAVAIHKPCRNYVGAVDYCSPLAYSAQPDRLWRNLGAKGGSKHPGFQDVTVALGFDQAFGAGLGVVSGDLDGDGLADLYVANDQSANQMWIQQSGGGFEDASLLAGTAVNAEGLPEAGMGIASGDIDGDGDWDLLVSHLNRETNTLYINEGDGFFEDRTSKSGMATASWGSTGFGLVWIDYDNDGLLDVAVANGAVKHLEHLVRAKDPFPLHEPNQLFRNLGSARFEEVTQDAGPAFALSEVSRGMAMGDIDNDGDSDLVISNNNGPLRLLRNQVGTQRPWLGLRLLTRSGRDALGAQVVVRRSGGGDLHRRVQVDGSYASASEPRILVGLGNHSKVTSVDVTWPDGDGAERFEIEGVQRYVTLRQGQGKALSSAGAAQGASSR